MMSALRVLHLSTETGWRGGEQQVKYLTDGLRTRGHDVLVLAAPGSPLLDDRTAAGIGRRWPTNGLHRLLAPSALRRIVAEWKPDILHAHTSHAHSILRRAAAHLGQPLVISRRVDFPIKETASARWKYAYPKFHYIAISNEVQQVLVRGGVPTNNVSVVHSGVDPERYVFRAGPPEPLASIREIKLQSPPIILNVAALTDHKDQSTLLRAFAILTKRGVNAQLVLAGTGELETALRQQANDLAIAHSTHFVGYVTPLNALFAAASVFVMSSHLEGLCTSILDAMAAGVPVAATQAGGIPEIVSHEVTGLLSPIRNPESLADNIQRLLGDDSLANRLRNQARAQVEECFSKDAMVEGTVAVYQKLLNREPK